MTESRAREIAQAVIVRIAEMIEETAKRTDLAPKTAPSEEVELASETMLMIAETVRELGSVVVVMRMRANEAYPS